MKYFQNLALVDEQLMVKEEISALEQQLAHVRSGKHQAEMERAESGKIQEKMIQDLQAKVEDLKISNRELTEKFESKEMAALEASAECDKAKSELFQANAKLDVFQKKEVNWKACQNELEALQFRYVLQGELVKKQKEYMDTLPSKAKHEELNLVREAANEEVASAKANLLLRSQEVTAAKAKIAEYEKKISDLHEGVKDQQKIIETIHLEHKEQLEAVESRHKALRSLNSHLESTVMELQVH